MKMFRRANAILAALLITGIALAGCGDATPAAPTPTMPPVDGKTPTAPGGAERTKVTIALGYIPDVQFAPFYVALNKGYYEAEGLDVTLRNGIVPDLIKELGTGQNDVNFAAVSGDEVIPARLQGIPVVYVMAWYRQYPVAAVSIDGKGPTLKSPADLKGKKVGVPGPYGSNYIGLQALLKAGGMSLNDIKLESINFTQVPSLIAQQVDVAMVYAANEPVQLASQGLSVSTLKVADYARLASNGLATNEKTINESPDLVAKVVRATLKGIQDTISDPAGAFESSLKQVPQAGGANKDLQMKILQETIKLMQPNPNDPTAKAPPQLGLVEQDVWQATIDFLLEAKIIDRTDDVTKMFTNRFVQQPPGQ